MSSRKAHTSFWLVRKITVSYGDTRGYKSVETSQRCRELIVKVETTTHDVIWHRGFDSTAKSELAPVKREQKHCDKPVAGPGQAQASRYRGRSNS